jgi:prepilin-type N-terminal cleavage/methylation domain-containing protein
MKRAFTMVELVMVIVVLGIVAGLGAEMIANAYRNYILQHAVHQASRRLETATERIAGLLTHRIPGTTLARNPDDLNDTVTVTTQIPNDKIHSMLEWIGTAYDSFAAAATPGWSGFCDLNASSSTTISTPGSNLNFASTVMANLSGNGVDLSGTVQRPAIIFRDMQYSDAIFYDPLRCMGMTDTNTSCISRVRMTGATTLAFDPVSAARPNKHLSEHYKLGWSAYAVCPTGDGENGESFDLVLLHNYQPWEGEYLSGGTRCDYNVGAGTAPERDLLVRQITVFKFAESGDAIRIRLCAQASIGEDRNITLCKEKVVLK